MYKFKFIEDVGRICYVCAQTRKKAIEIYCNEKNCNEEYVKKHCKIENWGKFSDFPKGNNRIALAM